MNPQWNFINCDRDTRRRVESYWRENRQAEVQSRLAELSPPPEDVRFAVARNGSAEEGEEEWSIQALVQCPHRSIAADVRALHMESALDEIASSLALQIDRAEEADAEQTIDVRGVQAVVPLLENFHDAGRSEAFFRFLAPLCRSLSSHAMRELEIQQAAGKLTPGELSVAELLDETLLRAWEGFDRRSKDLPLNLWLTRLLDEVLEDLEQGAIPESLNERRPAPDRDAAESQRDSWIDRVDEPESISLFDLLAGAPGLDALDRPDLTIKHQKLARLLRDLPRMRRQALVLHAADGYEPATIADLQDRPLDEVEQDIRDARGQLARQLSTDRRIADVLDIEQPKRPDRRKGDT